MLKYLAEEDEFEDYDTQMFNSKALDEGGQTPEIIKKAPVVVKPKTV